MFGGEGKESNLPSPTRRDRPVLKTGGATGPLPSPLRLTARRWRPATLAGRPSHGKTSLVPPARSVPPALSSSVPMSIALVNGPAAAAPRFRSRAESDTSVRLRPPSRSRTRAPPMVPRKASLVPLPFGTNAEAGTVTLVSLSCPPPGRRKRTRRRSRAPTFAIGPLLPTASTAQGVEERSGRRCEGARLGRARGRRGRDRDRCRAREVGARDRRRRGAELVGARRAALAVVAGRRPAELGARAADREAEVVDA